jgi:chitinase
MNELRTLFATDKARQYFISAAPQCVYPDASLGPDKERHNVTIPTAIQHAAFDWLNMQFYNNDCGVLYYDSKAFNFAHWAQTIPQLNPNPHIKLMLGVLSGSTAGGGYVNASVMARIVADLRSSPAFGGVMIWDDGYAIKNDNYQTQLKKMRVQSE